MASVSNGGLCNGVLNRGSSVTPKWKVRKVSAVRDFPPGCGPNAPKLKPKPVDDDEKNDVNNVKISENGNEPLSRPVDDEKKIEVSDANNVKILENGNDSNEPLSRLVDNEKKIDDVNGVQISENGNDSNEPLSRLVDNEKKNDVSDDNDIKISENGNESLSRLVDNEEKIDVSDDNVVKISENGDVLLSHEEVKSPSEVEMGSLLDDLVGKLVASAAMPVNGSDMSSSVKPLGDDFWQTLQIEASEFSHDFNKVETSVEAENEISPLPVSNGIIVKDPKVKTKYPKRRVSVTREFPPFCGRNAPCPTEEERAQIVRRRELLERERAKREEESVVTNENHKIEGLEEIVFEEKTEIASDVMRENNSPKRKLKVLAHEQKVKPKKLKEEKVVEKNENTEIVVFTGKSLDISNEDEEMRENNIESSKRKFVAQEQGQGSSRKKSASSRKVVAKKKVSVTREHDDVAHASLDRDDSILVSDEDGEMRDNNIESSKKNKGFVAQDQGQGSSRKKSASSRKVVAKKKVSATREHDDVAHAGPGTNKLEVTLPPFGPSSSSNGGNMRNKVRETLRLFQAICRKILQGEEANPNKQGKSSKRIDLEAAKIIKIRGKEVNTETQIIGSVPGVEVGDEFMYRVELALVGVHRLYQAGIDYLMNNGMIICVSIVASGGYADELDNPDILIYSGQGGMPAGKNKEAEDQKLERGNLALKNSIEAKNPVRVIRGTKEKASKSDSRGKMVPSYAYDGLYTVEKYWQEVGHKGKLVFKFELRRIPGQPELSWKEVKKSKKFTTREGVCVDDISNGKEVFRICAVNTIDNEKPPNFNYITKNIYPTWYSPTPPEGCGCVDGCSDSRKCSCVTKNGEEIPYNHNGAIVEAKPLVHECGPSCKCPPSCYNRVTQHGMRIQLEIFKTESRGWGVRSLSSIPSGSFICEYIGELLDDKEAERRQNDEYLFDIGQNYSDCQQSSSAEVAEDSGFTIDAAVYGNVGRFINHSCSPNLYAQNVLFDHEDKSMPHIMLFAAENIPALQELTYHYNYSVDQVRDSDGNVKMKSCYCGSEECTGRMY